jgi:UDP-N-acetylglucosamine--N-acetylmuramyl-(pentapeptide) pyrophosphoryl-undecaprenol N-acetylglucosamine transferase
MPSESHAPLIAIACGGTGGHLFPGLAVADALSQAGADLAIFVSNKAVDRAAMAVARPRMQVEYLEAVGWSARRPWRFVRGAVRSWRRVARSFQDCCPDAVLAMGGFTSLGPVLEARRLGVPSFLHESNTIPGRANRWLARWVDAVYVGFPEAAQRLRAREVREVGTPVRADIRPRSQRDCRQALGLDPDRPLLLICGGSQGARPINRLVVDALDLFRDRLPHLQFLHLSGRDDAAMVEAAYRQRGLRAGVHSFLDPMGEALGAADMAVSRAGASALAELAASRLPSLLIPYPTATDNHQVFNARAYADVDAARWCPQDDLNAEILVGHVTAVLNDPNRADRMRHALARWHRPKAAMEIARRILQSVARGGVDPRAHERSTGSEDDSTSNGSSGGNAAPCALAYGGSEGVS